MRSPEGHKVLKTFDMQILHLHINFAPLKQYGIKSMK